MTGFAIIGMACRLPGADTPGEFWQNLCAGVDSVSTLSDDELLAAGAPPALLGHPSYVKAAAMIRGADEFDAGFFGFSPREATLLDPQQRILLEVAWEAFEDAGYHPESYDGVAGVFAGGGGVVTSYLFAYAGHPALEVATASMPHLGNDKDFLATRVSYKLNLTGPSITVQTACSTSLVAIHLACQSLRAGECDIALVGATTVRVPHASGYLAEKGNVYSLDGRCRAFDAAAQGTIFGSGVAAVLLKPVEAALADGDQIYAVVKGSAINNDGGRKVSFPSPSATGQARAMVEAFTLADCSPDTVRYVECHATGTTVGDPPEIQALTRAFRQWSARTRFCAVGSVKTNIGHPEQAAGLAGLIKTALALRHGRIPPTLHLRTLNPKIDFTSSPFYVTTELEAWPADPHPRRAAVNSLGIGGTNAFVVMEQTPEAPAGTEVEGTDAGGPHVLTLSAKTESALLAYIERVAAFVARPPAGSLADLAYTSNVSRSQLPWRFAATAGRLDDLRATLGAIASGASPPIVANVRGAEPRVALLFSGQGSQYPRMALDLYRCHAGFREALDRCAAALREHLDVPLLELLASEGSAAERLDQTRYTQPAIVAVELALAQVWREWGLTPVAVLGHSVGEIAAACVAGVFPVEDALRLAVERGRLMQMLPPGGEMVAVLASEAAVHDMLRATPARVSIAAINGPTATVLSGDHEGVRQVVARLTEMHIRTRALRVSHAFHSALMDPVLDALEETALQSAAQAPTIPLVSSVTGRVLDRAPDAAYWRAHARDPVRFMDGLRAVHELGTTTFVEIGPGGTLSSLGRTVLDGGGTAWLTTLPRAGDEWKAVTHVLACLFLAGVDIDWRAVHHGMGRRRVSMPTYPFQRKRYWLDPMPAREGGIEASTAPGHATVAAPGSHPLLGPARRDGGATIFEAWWGLERLPYLRDHRVRGQLVLPTALAVEAGLAAGRSHFDRPAVALEGLVYQEVFRLGEARAQQVRITVRAVAPDRANFSLASHAADGSWRTHVTGVITSSVADDGGGLDEAAVGCPLALSQGEFYERLRVLGLEYGPAFRGLEEVRQGHGVAVGRVRLPAGVAPNGYATHPAFLDACLHLFPAVLDGAATHDAVATHLPVGIERVRLYRTGAAAGTVTAVRRAGTPGETGVVVDLRVVDDESRPVLGISGLRLRALSMKALGERDDGAAGPGLYHVLWESRPRAQVGTESPPASPGTWLVFANGDGLGAEVLAALADRGQRGLLVTPGQALSRRGARWSIDPRRAEHFHRVVREVAGNGLPLRGGVLLWATGNATPDTAAALDRQQVRGVGAALLLTQAWLAARADIPEMGRLWLLTRNEQAPTPDGTPAASAGAMLWGFGRTVALEAPGIWGGLIDLPPASDPFDAATLVRELLEPDDERQITFRSGARYAARLERLPPSPPASMGARVHADATYLITGGLGMLGLRTARLLVEEHGARSVVLVGRRRPSPHAQRTLRALRARGAEVRVLAADVAREADVRRLLRAIHGLPPLRGIFHGAGVLNDAILALMTPAHLARVAAAKVRGAWLLHRHTARMSLDFFVLHSSLLSVTGSPGQANYTAANAYLDALAGHRRAIGLSATALNWGPWGENGMARSTGARGEAMWKARGVSYLSPEDAVGALDLALRGEPSQLVVADVDWSRLLGHAPMSARLREATQPGADDAAATRAEVADVRDRLRASRGAERRALVLDVVRRQVMSELGFTEPIDTRQPLDELGLDSLMSVNVANRLEEALGMPVPVARLIRGPSVEQLVEELVGDLGPAAGAAAPADISPVDSGEAVSSTERDGWLITPRRRPSATMRLVCFPFAGAGAGPFRRWAETLDPSIELVAIEPPGRASRIHEPPERNLEFFMTRLGDALAPILDRPAAFFGHCLGGLIAWEMARRLRHRGGFDLRAFFVAGVRPPHRLAVEGPFEHGLLERLLRQQRFDPLRPIHEQPDEVFIEVTRHFDIPATDDFLAQPELRRLLLPTVRADFALTAAYHHDPEPAWDVPVTCFAGLDDPYVSRDDAAAWGSYTRRSFRLHWRSGAHFLVVEDRDFIVTTINRELTT